MRKIAFLILTISLLFPLSATALEIIPKDTFAIDNTLSDQVEDFNLADSIVIAPLKMPEEALLQDIDLYAGLYYYQTVRLNQKDFLAHYFVTSDGTILQGNSLGVEQRIKLYQREDKPIIIMYICRNDATDLTPTAKSALKQLLLTTANSEAIKLENISIENMELYAKQGEPILLKLSELPGRWQVSLKEMLEEIKGQYNPTPKQYSLTVEKITIPEGKIIFPNTVEASITIKNNSPFVLYQDTQYEPLIAKLDNSPSKFYLNETWLSQTQAPFMSTGDKIKPQETKTFTIKLQAPLYFGNISEKYQLMNALGQAYTSTEFDLAMNVDRPEASVVEITQTETGQLNVRDGPWSSSAVIGRVTPGQRFLVIERTDSGYIKLDLGSGKTGWVVSKYTKTV